MQDRKASQTSLDAHQQHQLQLHYYHQVEAERRLKEIKEANQQHRSKINRPQSERRASVSRIEQSEKSQQHRREQEARILVTESLEERVRAEQLARFMARLHRRDSRTSASCMSIKHV